MALRIFLVITFGITLPIMYFILRTYRNAQGDQIFGITIGSPHMKDEDIIRIQKRYIKEMNWYSLLLLGILLGAGFIPYLSICYTVLMFWLGLLIVVLQIPFMKANSAVKQLKLARGWKEEFTKNLVVDTEVAKQQDRMACKSSFLISGILIAVPIVTYIIRIVMGKAKVGDLTFVLSMSSASIVILAVGLLMQRMRYGTATANSQVNQAVARVKRYHWAKGMAGCTLSTSLFNGLMIMEYFLEWKHMTLVIFANIIYGVFVISWLFYTVYQGYRIKTKLIGEEAPLVQDDDDYWIYGMFYYNKNDSSFMVEKRVGIGTTVNMARPAAKVSMVILAIVLLMIPASCIWMLADEFTPVSLFVTEETLKSSQFEGTYSIELSKIKKIEAMTKLPDNTKLVGTGMDNLLRGSFRVEGYENCTLCLDPRNAFFIAITMDNDKVYLLSDKTDTGTKAIYDKLLLQMKQSVIE